MKVSSLWLLKQVILKIMMADVFRMIRKAKKSFQQGFREVHASPDLQGPSQGNHHVLCTGSVTQTLPFHLKVKAQRNTALKSGREFYLGSRRQSLCCRFWSCGRVPPAFLTAGLVHSRLLYLRAVLPALS